VRPGFVCGLASEAACLPSGALFGLSGARPQKAEEEAERLADEGAEALVSFGVAGGPDKGPVSGARLGPAGGIEEDGTIHEADPALTEALVGHYPHGRLLGSDRLVEGRREKTILRAVHAADAVDMESHRVARVAARRGLPFAALRAVADPAGMGLPLAARAAVREDGGVAILAVLAGLARRPSDLPLLIKLGRHSRAAHETLRRLASAMPARIEPADMHLAQAGGGVPDEEGRLS
jgi:adenosylhomocysteine nucleosidase